MAIFTEAEIDRDWHTFTMFRDGGVVLFKNMDLFENCLKQLEDQRYETHHIECPHSIEPSSLLSLITKEFRIQASDSVGLDGFDDYLWNMSFGSEKGKVLAISGFHHYRNKHKKAAKSLLDILSHHHRINLLTGNRLLILLQSNDSTIDEKLGEIGGYNVIWNQKEWMFKDRGL